MLVDVVISTFFFFFDNFIDTTFGQENLNHDSLLKREQTVFFFFKNTKYFNTHTQKGGCLKETDIGVYSVRNLLTQLPLII